MPVSNQDKPHGIQSKLLWLGAIVLPSLAIIYLAFGQRAMVHSRQLGLPFHRSTFALYFTLALAVSGAVCIWFNYSAQKWAFGRLLFYILLMVLSLVVLPPILAAFWPW